MSFDGSIYNMYCIVHHLPQKLLNCSLYCVAHRILYISSCTVPALRGFIKYISEQHAVHFITVTDRWDKLLLLTDHMLYTQGNSGSHSLILCFSAAVQYVAHKFTLKCLERPNLPTGTTISLKKSPSQGQRHTYNKPNWEFGPSTAVNVKDQLSGFDQK